MNERAASANLVRLVEDVAANGQRTLGAQTGRGDSRRDQSARPVTDGDVGFRLNRSRLNLNGLE